MAAPSRDDLNAALDNIDGLKNTRAVAKVSASTATTNLAAAQTASDKAAADLLTAGTELADAITQFGQMLSDYTADQAAPSAAARRATSAPVNVARAASNR